MARAKKLYFSWTTLAVSLLLTGCASIEDPAAAIGTRVPHVLKAEIVSKNPGLHYLDIEYRHNDTKIAGPSKGYAERMKPRGFDSFQSEAHRVGDSVYVKWHNMFADEVYEQAIDLKDGYPVSVKTGADLYLVLGDADAHLYLVEPLPPFEKRTPASGCDELRQVARKEPTPDKKAVAAYCQRTLWKIHPESIKLHEP